MTILETIPIIEQAGKYIQFILTGYIGIILSVVFMAIAMKNDKFNIAIVGMTGVVVSICLLIGGIIATIAEPPTDTGC